MTAERFLLWGDNEHTAIITRMELSTSTIAWSMYYRDKDRDMELIDGLALNPDNTKLAVHGFDIFPNYEW